ATAEAFDIGGVSLGVVGPLAIPDATPVPVSFSIPGIKTIVIIGTRGWSPLLNDHVFCPESGGGTVPVQIAGLPSGSTFPVGTTTNTFEYDDGINPVQTCSFDVTINETEAPQLSNCTGSVQSTDTGCVFNGSGGTFIITENCGDVTLDEEYFDEAGNNFLNLQWTLPPGAYSLGGGRQFPVGINTVVLTATDSSGNTATCSLTVEVIDDVLP